LQEVSKQQQESNAELARELALAREKAQALERRLAGREQQGQQLER
jgi:hypothetical protein